MPLYLSLLSFQLNFLPPLPSLTLLVTNDVRFWPQNPSFSKAGAGEDSRWQNKRILNSSFLTSISRMEQFSQSTCWTLVEDFGHQKGQEKSPLNRVRQKKEKKKRGIKTGTSNPGRKLKVKKGPHTQKSSLMVGKSAGIERDLQGDQRRTQWMTFGRQDKVWTVCMLCAAALRIPAWVVSLLLWSSWGAGKWGLECGPREGTAFGCEKTAWRDRNKELHNWESLQKKPRTQ